MDMFIPTERNTSLKTIEKLTKYKDLKIEIEKMRGMKTITVPVIIGAFGLINKGNRKLHRQDPRQYQNNRATEDCPP